MIEKLRALVEAGRMSLVMMPTELKAYAQMRDALSAVEPLLSHCEIVAIPQGADCEDCGFLDDDDLCRNPEWPAAVDADLSETHGIRCGWCRQRYGYSEEGKHGTGG